ncbi:MAG: DinB family protein [Acidobacteriota bacterium]
MKRILACLILLLSAAALASAQSLTAADRDRALKHLESTRQSVVDATTGLSEAQWNFKAGPDRWSLAQVMEHIAAAEDLMRGMIEGQVLKAPPRSDGEDVAAVDAMVLKAIPDRSHKAQAPEPLQPTNRFGSPQDALKHFLESRSATVKLLNDRPDLRDHAADSPLGKKLDGYEWILFISAHSERHTKQMLEVKADPNFPKK